MTAPGRARGSTEGALFGSVRHSGAAAMPRLRALHDHRAGNHGPIGCPAVSSIGGTHPESSSPKSNQPKPLVASLGVTQALTFPSRGRGLRLLKKLAPEIGELERLCTVEVG